MHSVKVMVLGTFHYHQEGIEYLDIQSQMRQDEIKIVVDRLSAFKPTAIAVERQPNRFHDINERYKRFLNDGIIDVNSLHKSGTAESNTGDVHEVAMLGFRLARNNGIEKIDCIDYMNDWLYNEAYEFAQQNQISVAKEIKEKEAEYVNYMFSNASGTVTDIYKFMNSKDTIRKQHSDMFLIMNQIGDESNDIGTKFVSSWYYRNLRIFSNLQQLCMDNERVFVLIGAGHCAILNDMIDNYYKMEFISPLEYL